MYGSKEAPSPLSVTGQPLDGAPAVFHLHFRFHGSLPGCLWLTMHPLSPLGPVDCNFGDGLSILVQHEPDPAPLLPDYDGLHILLLAQC